jgi:hypothetical protein
VHEVEELSAPEVRLLPRPRLEVDEAEAPLASEVPEERVVLLDPDLQEDHVVGPNRPSSARKPTSQSPRVAREEKSTSAARVRTSRAPVR